MRCEKNLHGNVPRSVCRPGWNGPPVLTATHVRVVPASDTIVAPVTFKKTLAPLRLQTQMHICVLNYCSPIHLPTTRMFADLTHLVVRVRCPCSGAVFMRVTSVSSNKEMHCARRIPTAGQQSCLSVCCILLAGCKGSVLDPGHDR